MVTATYFELSWLKVYKVASPVGELELTAPCVHTLLNNSPRVVSCGLVNKYHPFSSLFPAILGFPKTVAKFNETESAPIEC